MSTPTTTTASGASGPAPHLGGGAPGGTSPRFLHTSQGSVALAHIVQYIYEPTSAYRSAPERLLLYLVGPRTLELAGQEAHLAAGLLGSL